MTTSSDPAEASPRLRAWEAGQDPAGRTQASAEEIVAEHELIRGVLDSMEEETRRLFARAPIDIDFWADIVEFVGNFVHLCHRAKEEDGWMKVMATRNRETQSELAVALRQEHAKACDLTLAICDGVESGDWEKVLRSSGTYVAMMRKHMDTEEIALQAAHLTAPEEAKIREEFNRIEAEALREHPRAGVVELARRIGKRPA